MVFCGKPSKGCSNCRKRRIKCDQLSPACSQCLRAKKECQGYRDQTALMFRDENERVARKALALTPKPKSSENCTPTIPRAPTTLEEPGTTARGWFYEPLSYDGSHDWQSLAQQLLPQQPSSPWINEGIRFFVEHYTTLDTTMKESIMTSKVMLLLTLDQTFRDAVSSVGYAGLSNVTRNDDFMVLARKNYSSGIKGVAAVIKSTERSELSTALRSALRSVMVLSAYELVNCESGGFGSWGIHIDGGTAIVKMIELDCPDGLPASSRRKLQFILFVLIKSVSRGEAPPEKMHTWIKRCINVTDDTDTPAATLADIMLRFIELYTLVKQCVISDPDTIIHKALAFDAELEAWHSRLPQEWCFPTITITATDDSLQHTYNGQAELSSDEWLQRVYNNYRWTRILVNELFLINMRKIGLKWSEDTAQRTRSLAIISSAATGMCSSVSTQLQRKPLENYHLADKRGQAPMSGCFLILLPLAVAASAIGVSEEVYGYATRMLEIIGREKGIAQALALIPVVTVRREKWMNGTERYFGF